MIKILIYLITFLLLVNIFYFYRFIDTKNFDDFIQKPLHLGEINTGDVFIVSYQNLTTIMTGGFLRTKFLHPSVAVWDHGELFMIELINYNNKEKGYLKVPINKWIKYNQNTITMINKLEITEGNEEEIRKQLSEKILIFYEKVKDKITHIGAFNKKWMRFYYPSEEYKELDIEDDTMVCVETTAAMLIEIGIVKKNKSLEKYIPDAYINMKEFDLEKGFLFKESYICDFTSFKTLIYK